MINAQRKIKSIFTLVSYAAVDWLESPRGFCAKVKAFFGHGVTAAAHFKALGAVERSVYLGQFDEVHNSTSGWREKLLYLGARRRVSRVRYWQHQAALVTKAPTGQSGVKPRVLLYLTNGLPYTQSGYSLRSQNLASAALKQGIQVKLLTRLGYPSTIGRPVGEQFSVVDSVVYHHLPTTIWKWNYRNEFEESVKSLVEHGVSFRANLLHTTTDYKNAAIVANAAKLLNVPWIYEVRGHLELTWLSKIPESEQAQALKSEYFLGAVSAETEVAKAASRVIALSEVSKQLLVKRGVPQDKIDVIPNGIDSDILNIRFDKKELREELGLPANSRIVGTVTSVVSYEGLDSLVEAVAKTEGVMCVVVGEGEALNSLKQLADKLRVTERILFVGKQPASAVWKWYAVLDAFVLPRKDLPVTRSVTPLKPLIALALGVPVVASDLEALLEVTGGNMERARPDDPLDLRRAILKVLDSPPCPEPGINWAKSRTWQANAVRLESIYDDALKSDHL